MLENSTCYADTDFIAQAIQSNASLRILRWLYAAGHHVKPNHMHLAMSWTRIHIIEWLLEVGLTIDKSTTFEAVNTGRVEVMRWLEAHGYRINVAKALRYYRLGYGDTNYIDEAFEYLKNLEQERLLSLDSTSDDDSDGANDERDFPE